MIEMVVVILSWAYKRKVKTRFALSRTLKPLSVPLIPGPSPRGEGGASKPKIFKAPYAMTES